MACPFAGALGEPGKGVHSQRIFGLAFFDMLMTMVYSWAILGKFSDFAHCMVYGWGNSPLFIWSSNGFLEDGGNCTEMRLGGVRLQNKNERGWENWAGRPRIRQKVDFDRPCSTKSRVKCPLILPPPLV